MKKEWGMEIIQKNNHNLKIDQDLIFSRMRLRSMLRPQKLNMEAKEEAITGREFETMNFLRVMVLIPSNFIHEKQRRLHLLRARHYCCIFSDIRNRPFAYYLSFVKASP